MDEKKIELDLKYLPQAKLEATNPVSKIDGDKILFAFDGVDEQGYNLEINLAKGCIKNDRIVGWFSGDTNGATIGGNNNQVITRIIDSGATYEVRTMDSYNNKTFILNDNARWDEDGGIGGFGHNSPYNPLPSTPAGDYSFALKDGFRVYMNGNFSEERNSQFPYIDLDDPSKGLINGNGNNMHVVEYGICLNCGSQEFLSNRLISNSNIVFLYIPENAWRCSDSSSSSTIKGISDGAFSNNQNLIGIWDDTSSDCEYDASAFSGCDNIQWVFVANDRNVNGKWQKESVFVDRFEDDKYIGNSKFRNLKYYNGYIVNHNN